MKLFKTLISLFSFVLILTTVSCKKENMCDCIKRTGKIKKEKRNVIGFNKLLVDNDVNVIITQDTVYNVEVEAGENIIPLIKTEVNNGELIIEDKNRCKWVRAYGKTLNVYISMPELVNIVSKSSGKIKSTNTITADRIDIEIRSSGDVVLSVNNTTVGSVLRNVGDIYLQGTTNNHMCYLAGNAFVYSQELNTAYTEIETHSTGNSYLKTSNKLVCKIAGVGDVFCYGNPSEISSSITDKGQLYLK